MKKKIITALALTGFACTFLGVFAGCNSEKEHTYYYDSESQKIVCANHADVSMPLQIRFNKSKATASVIGASGELSGALEIPSSVRNGKDGETYPVTAIAYESFSGKGITSVSIPASVITIEANAFANCASLSSVTFAADSKLEDLESLAFSGTALTSVSLPASLKSISNYTFSGCTALSSVTLQEGVEELGNYLFSGCTALTGISVPASVKEIGMNAFENCTNLASVTFASGSKLGEIKSDTFRGCSKLTAISLPSTATKVGVSAFQGCSALANVSLGGSVKSIANSAFRDCTSLRSIFLPELTSLGGYAFYGCTTLEAIDFDGDNLTWRNLVKDVVGWVSEDQELEVRCGDKDLQYTGTAQK